MDVTLRAMFIPSGRAWLIVLVLALLPSGCHSPNASGPRVIGPGAPGEPSRVLTPEEAEFSVSPRVTRADVHFMQGMIAHHAQALTMTGLAPNRVADEGVRLLAQRIDRSQGDEIALIERWLRERGEEIPDPALGYQIQPAAGRPVLMPGMLTSAELAELEAAAGPEFDRLFLVYMIRHHEGALTMVRELFESEGSGRESVIFEFAVDVDSDQRIEIARMVRMLTGSL